MRDTFGRAINFALCFLMENRCRVAPLSHEIFVLQTSHASSDDRIVSGVLINRKQTKCAIYSPTPYGALRFLLGNRCRGPGSPELSWTLLGSLGLSWVVLGFPALSWALLGSPELSCVVLGSLGPSLACLCFFP
jgi:hypothetical protein